MRTFAICVVVLVVKSANAGEWQTSSGQLCIDKCKYHDDEKYFHWCHVSDNSRTYSDGTYSQSWSIDRNGPSTHLKWDYCVPSESLEYDRPPNQWENQKPDFNQGQNDNDGGLEWHDPNAPDDSLEDDEITDESVPHLTPKGPSSVLYRLTQCQGPCTYSMQTGARPVCKVDNHPLAYFIGFDTYFYCVDERMPVRQQLSSLYRLWCQDSCRKETSSHFFCSTLYGVDHCSPQPNIGSNGGKCAYPCQHYESLVDEYFFCYTKADNSSWEYCGNWNVPKEKKEIIEFTRYDYVCADYCRPDEDNEYEWCYHVYWDYNATLNQADLRKTWDYCRGQVPPSMAGWKIALIVLGVIGAIGLMVGGVLIFDKFSS